MVEIEKIRIADIEEKDEKRESAFLLVTDQKKPSNTIIVTDKGFIL